MPFPNEHACRLNPPNYPKYARQNCKVKHNGKCIDFIYGVRGPNQSELQSMRYPKKIWDAGAARAHCKSKKGTFEAASGRTIMEIYLKSEGQYVKNEMSQEDYLNWFKSNVDDEGNVIEDCLLYKDGEFDINTDKSITFVMSDDFLDRDFEKFDTTGWDLKAYKKNPVLLWSHDRDIPAIGKMEKVRVKENRLIGNPVFDQEDNLAKQIECKIHNGFIKAGSVGFFPNKVEIPEDEKDPCKLIYRKQELREFSICNVPANPNAVILDEDKSVDINVKMDGQQLIYDKIQIVDDNSELKDEIEEMKIDIENLKEMQMKMAETVTKDNRNYYEELLNRKKKPQSKGLEKLYPRKSE